jgi:NAD(P)-dependent dehydrogenase (short-subunit alcohol dehydrogenase family)
MEATTTSQSQTAVVTGGSRGLGRGVVEALVARGMRVVAIARDAARLEAAAGKTRAEHVAADAADEITAGRLLQELRPDLVVLCAGALPLLRPFHLHTWETFSQNWEVDMKAAFVWLRNAMLLPMKDGGHVVVVSSIAATHGSPLSGGYAGAKRMQWMLADYASQEVARLKLKIRIHCVLPTLNPNTDLGRATIAAYAQRAGVSTEEFAKSFNPPLSLTPSIFGQAVADLHENPERWDKLAYRVGGDGLTPLS